MRKTELVRTIVLVIGLGGFVIATAALPGAALLLLPFVEERGYHAERRSLLRALSRLKHYRVVKLVTEDGISKLEVTEQGKRWLRDFQVDEMEIPLPKKWDGQWTMILFDIPERLKVARDALRLKMTELGCLPFHKSVFVHPTDCRDEIDFLSKFFSVEPFVVHFRTPTLGKGEYRARMFFELK